MKPFKDYLKSGEAVQVPIDRIMARELIMQAPKKLKEVSSKELNPETAPFRFMGAYEVMRDCVNCLMAIDGYRTVSGEATIAYLVERYQPYFGEKLIHSFGQYIGFGSDVIHRAAPITVGQAEEAIKVAGKFIPITQDLYEARLTLLA